MRNILGLIMKLSFNSTKRVILQMVLLYVAYLSFNKCLELGLQYRSESGWINAQSFTEKMERLEKGEIELEKTPSSVAIETRFNGGAVGMGLICASCIMAVSVIELINKKVN